MTEQSTRVVVTGGGYAGVIAANRLRLRTGIDITLVNPESIFTESEVNVNLAHGDLADYDLPVTGDDGGFPVVVALESERLSTLSGRLRAVGGYANVFVRGRRLPRVTAKWRRHLCCRRS